MMANRTTATLDGGGDSQPLLEQHSPLIQEYGTLRLLPIALGHEGVTV